MSEDSELSRCILHQGFFADLVILSCSVFFAVPLFGLMLREFPSNYMCWFASYFARRELNCEGAKSAALASCSEVRAQVGFAAFLSD